MSAREATELFTEEHYAAVADRLLRAYGRRLTTGTVLRCLATCAQSLADHPSQMSAEQAAPLLEPLATSVIESRLGRLHAPRRRSRAVPQQRLVG